MLNYYSPMQAPFMAQPQFVAPAPQETEDIKYVNGKQGAEAYQMFANRKAILMDANMSRFYMYSLHFFIIITFNSFGYEFSVFNGFNFFSFSPYIITSICLIA